jgi:hypothetical protein
VTEKMRRKESHQDGATHKRGWVKGLSKPPLRSFKTWGVGQRCNCQHMLSAIASLIRAQRYEVALLLLEEAFSEHR